MDFFKYLDGLVKTAGVEGSTKILFMIIVILGFLVWLNHAKSNNNLAKSVNDNFSTLSRSLKEIAKSRYCFNTDETIEIFLLYCFRHTQIKAEFLEKILKKNDIIKRKPEIERNIKSFFKKTTNQGIISLSKYKSVVGDIGIIVDHNIDWEELFHDTFEIVFDDCSTIEQKIYDFKKRMDEYIDKLVVKIKEYGDKNE